MSALCAPLSGPPRARSLHFGFPNSALQAHPMLEKLFGVYAGIVFFQIKIVKKPAKNTLLHWGAGIDIKFSAFFYVHPFISSRTVELIVEHPFF